MGRVPLPNRMNFWKKGGGIFNPEIYVAGFGNFTQGFLSMKLIKKESKFKVQGMFLHPLQSKIIMYQGNKKMAQSPFF